MTIPELQPKEPPATEDGGPARAEETVADAVGSFLEAMGYPRSMGQIWATLFLSPEPIPAPELCEKLGISPASASMRLAELERWGIVQRTKRAGQRSRDLMVDSNAAKLFARLIAERELRLLGQLATRLETALGEYGREVEPAGAYSMERIEGLLRLTRMGERLFSTMVGRADLSPEAAEVPQILIDPPSYPMDAAPATISTLPRVANGHG